MSSDLRRSDGRAPADLRPVKIECDVVSWAEGSCLYTLGRTKVFITASIESRVPPFLRDTGEGWVTAEYGMLPRATKDRTPREAARGKQSGRTLEIQRLVGRALRGAVNRQAFPEHTITLDCDVLEADAGTRCASVTGGFVALALALAKLSAANNVRGNPFVGCVAAVSVGLAARVPGADVRTPILDLDYAEDSSADVDLNVVGTSEGRFVEVQGTAEKGAFSEEELSALLGSARTGLSALFDAQRSALEGRLPAAFKI